MNKIKIFFIFVILFGLFEFIPNTHSLCGTGELYVGIAKVDITPPVGIRMWGYGARKGKDPSLGIHDPLYAGFLVLDVNEFRTAIITCDLGSYSSREISDIVKERFNIHHVLVNVSHTHSGPDLSDSESYRNSVKKALIDGLDEAVGNMFPARISTGSSTFPQIGYNRLTDRGERSANFRNDERIPYGPVDPEVGVMKIEDKRGNPRVILMMYACHSVANGINYEISADYPGVAMRKVDEAFGNNTMSMFVQGGAGDINPLFMSVHRGPNNNPPTDYTQIEKMGTLLANEVIKVVKSLPPQINKKIELNVKCDSLEFKFRYNDEERIRMVHFATVLINDDIAIATMRGEPFSWFQLFWKEYAEVAHPFFFGYTSCCGGGSLGYVPDIKSAAYGGVRR